MGQLWKCRTGVWVAAVALFCVSAGILHPVPALFAQTAVTGGLNGVVADTTGAVVAGATVTLVEIHTGDTRVLTTNDRGLYTAPFLKPGTYRVSASARGLESTTTSVEILVGQQSEANLTVSPSASKQTVMVSANNAQLIQTQDATLTTTFTAEQFENLPNPGGDITTIAFTVPGVVMNTGTYGNGNFSTSGLPGISNLIILNGADQTDSFFNDATTGASTLSIGASEVAEASFVQNGYNPEWGRQAAGVETYVTKSGSNRVHGLLNWTYNSDGLNANDFFYNLNGIPRQKAVSNQYAAQIGGPIIRDRLFFFADTEGIRYVEPSLSYVNFPTPAFENTTLNTVPTASVPLYTTMFNLLGGSPLYKTSVPVGNGDGPLQDASGTLGCGSFAGTPVYGQPNTYFGVVPANSAGSAVPCMTAAAGVTRGAVTEHMIVGRVDWNVSERQKLFVRISDDHGSKPVSVSLVNPLLNVQTAQPIWNGQLNHTYVFKPDLTNQFIASAFYYSWPFGPVNLQQTLAASPTQFNDGSDGGTNFSIGLGQAGTIGFNWGGNPTTTNSVQYQFVDDLSWLKGNHTLKFGVNFKRYDVTDGYPEVNTYGGFYTFNSLGDLAGGVLPGSAGSNFQQTFDQAKEIAIAGYNYGLYAQDEWRATPRLMVDYGVRVDRDGNITCKTNCFSRLVGGFPQANATLDSPYNQLLATGYKHVFSSLEAAVIQPRFGFNWDVRGNGKTDLRGGFGLFADAFPGALIENQYLTFPDNYGAFVEAGNVAEGTGSAAAFAQASYNALTAGFANGQSANQIAASLPAGSPFFAPAHYISPQHMVTAKYAEWSLQFQQQFRASDALICAYIGNRGYDGISYDYGINESLAGNAYTAPSGYSSFEDVPVNPTDPAFGQMGIINDDAGSSYNGTYIQYKHIDRRGVTADISYTWSHALDDVSNQGQDEVFNGNGLPFQIVPNHPSLLMYSNADYDIRNNFLVDFTYVEPYHFATKLGELGAAGWTIAGKTYWRSGQPFSVFNNAAANDLYNGTGNYYVLADVLGNNFSHYCNSFSHPCFQGHDFNGSGAYPGSDGDPDAYGDPPQTNFGNIPRNAFYGPHYADVDLSLYKNLFQNERGIQFKVGAQGYNLLNHPAFAAPQNNASFSNLGLIESDVVQPTGPYGSFGSTSFGRIVVVTGKLIF
ncbi:MAG TPA: carboxypeptidase regulatory-like domain-containing protein [Acidobacteriaceae bacterium]|nr:carboxypeptidase regulatory-like domain-containing protein [Acidobacteriaceae bacterium]